MNFMLTIFLYEIPERSLSIVYFMDRFSNTCCFTSVWTFYLKTITSFQEQNYIEAQILKISFKIAQYGNFESSKNNNGVILNILLPLKDWIEILHFGKRFNGALQKSATYGGFSFVKYKRS